MNKRVMTFIIFVAIIGMILGYVVISSPSQSSTASQTVNPQLLERKGAFTIGPSDAKAKIVEFSDFQCPACKDKKQEIDDLLNKYPKDLSLTYRYFPLDYHSGSKIAAQGAQASGDQGKFKQMHDRLFDDQDNINEDNIKKWAKEIGLDMDKFNTDYNSQKTKDAIAADLKAGEEIGLKGTPTIYLNGIEVTGSLTSQIGDLLGK